MLSNIFKRKRYLKNDVVIILGMHRSGTSCLTGLLQQAGLELGDIVEEAPYNKKGNRENVDIMELNNDVLLNNKGSWDSPPNQLTWNETLQLRRDEILMRYIDKNIWGFKDPRVIFTLPFWLDGLKKAQLHYIGTFRHPLLVAKSLNSRQPDLSIEKGVALWLRYNEQLCYYHEKFHFPIIDFDLEQKAYINAVLLAMKRLNILSGHDSNLLDFFDDNLRHQNVINDDEFLGFSKDFEPAMSLYTRLKAKI
jgi:hypothetical protein